jgi:hypothetical protein
MKSLPTELAEFRSKEYEDLKTYEIYQSLLMIQPELNLREFLDAHPIFRINFQYMKFIQRSNKQPPSKK